MLAAPWNEAGVWDELHLVLLKKLRAAKKLAWPRAVIDSSHVRAARRGPKAGPARSTAHGRAEHHVLTDGQGIPLAVSLTGGYHNDVTQLLPLLDKVPAMAGVVAAQTPT
ncbi:transposase [Streptomyces avermitilis]|uniref:transposase n=1 Tax=Streptomyces avermitilis TaxID=33903 RepID=UPI003812990D